MLFIGANKSQDEKVSGWLGPYESMHNGPEIVLVLQLQRNVKALLKAMVSKGKGDCEGGKIN